MREIYIGCRARGTSEASLTGLKVSLLFIMTKQNCTNQRVVLNYLLLAAQEPYLAIDVTTSLADNHVPLDVPYLKASLSKRDGGGGGRTLAL